MQAAAYHEYNNEFLSMEFKSKYPHCSVMHSRYQLLIKRISKSQQAVYTAICSIGHDNNGLKLNQIAMQQQEYISIYMEHGT